MQTYQSPVSRGVGGFYQLVHIELLSRITPAPAINLSIGTEPRRARPLSTDFEQKVWKQCRKIPRGKVCTYSAIAEKMGLPGAARAVGNALNKSPGMPRVPCHRVVKSDGSVGGFAHGSNAKIALLEKEGVRVEKRRVDLQEFGARF